MTKNNRTLLYLYTWKLELKDEDTALETAIDVLIRNWDKLTPPESILRCQRIIQNEKNDYQPTPQVVKLRKKEQEKWKDWAIEEK
tara:strand:+ start:480 stop:734 length:255 start_codon:yes stop_codon:yes gene_type:complete